MGAILATSGQHVSLAKAGCGVGLGMDASHGGLMRRILDEVRASADLGY